MPSIDPEIIERINGAQKRIFPRISALNIALTSTQKRALILVGVGAIAISALSLFSGQARPNGDVVVAQPSVSAIPGESSTVVVDVQGEIVNPGIYQLPLGSRVADAIKAAGGVINGSDSSAVNLARFLEDGEQVYVAEINAAGIEGNSALGSGNISRGKLNLNRATASELDGLPGVGPVLAGRITAHRSEHGNFSSVDELRKVSGIGPAKFRELRDFVTV
jgi:competence protein ComEA